MDDALYEKFYAVEEWYWWSVGTRAIFRDWLRAALPAARARVLDVGCGTGIFVREIADLGDVTGIDVSPHAVAFGVRRGLDRLCVGSAERLPYRSGAFDAVTALDIIEHTDDQQTVPEIARVLRPGGFALIHVPAFPLLWGEHDEVNRHLRRYRRGPLEAVLGAHGLAVERLSYVNCLLFPAALAVRLAKRVVRPLQTPRPPRAEIYDLPRWLNRSLLAILVLERAAMQRRLRLPFGVSILCLARKRNGRRSDA